MRIDEEIKSALDRLGRGAFAPSDWPLWCEEVAGVVSRHRLPAAEYAPDSRFGGNKWAEDDFSAIAEGWLFSIRGSGARRLLGNGPSNLQIRARAKRSIYQHVLRGRRKSAGSDLWQALREVRAEFPALFDPPPALESVRVTESFPFEVCRAVRARAVTAVEVRRAILLLSKHQPSGWTLASLFDTLFHWAGLSGQSTPLDLASEPAIAEPAPDLRLQGRELAERVRSLLNREEMSILQSYILPRELAKRTLDEAAIELNMAPSTLHDRARKISAKLEKHFTDDATDSHPVIAEEFVTEILRPVGGKRAVGRAINEKVEGSNG